MSGGKLFGVIFAAVLAANLATLNLTAFHPSRARAHAREAAYTTRSRGQIIGRNYRARNLRGILNKDIAY